MSSVRGVFFCCHLILQASFAFAGEDDLQVQSFKPQGEVKNVRQLVIEFDRPVARLGESVSDAQLAHIDIKPDLKCEWRSLGLDRIACELPEGASLATEYTVRILPGFSALDGSRTAQMTEYRFSTPRPELDIFQQVEFENPRLPVLQVYSHAHSIIPESLLQHLYLKDNNGHRHPLKLRPQKEERSKGSWWTVVPAMDLPAGENYSLVISPGLKSRNGPLAGAQDHILQSFSTYAEFKVAGIKCAHYENKPDAEEHPENRPPQFLPYDPKSSPPCLYNRVRILFTAPVNASQARASLQVLPGVLPRHNEEITSSISQMEEGVDLDGLLAPGRSQRLRLPAGAQLKDQFGRPLSKDFEMTVRTADLKESVSLLGDTVLEQGQVTDLPVIVANAQAASIEGRIYSPASGKGRAIAGTRFWEGGIDNQWHVADTGLRKLFGSGSGYFTGTVTASGKPMPLNAQVTPFNIASFATFSGYWIWVIRMNNAEPVAKASVRVYSNKSGQPQEKARAKSFKTDSSGLVFIPYKDIEVPPFKDYKDAPRLIIEVVKDSDSGYLSIGSDRLRAAPYGVDTAWTEFSQPLYQPGDSVKFKIYARELTTQGYKTPARSNAKISIQYYGDEQEGYLPGFEEKNIDWSDFGTYSDEFELPANAPHGLYTITLDFGGISGDVDAGQFVVAEFNKQEFELKLVTDKKTIGPGEPVTVTAMAALQNGGAYADARASLKASLEAESDLFWDDPILEDFDFQAAAEEGVEEKSLFEVQGSTDVHGNFTRRFIPDARDIYFGTLFFEAAVEDARGKAIHQSSSIPYYAVDRLVGLRFGTSETTAGESLEAKAIVINAADRQLVDAVPVEFRIERDTMHQYNDYWGKEYRWHSLKNCRLKSAAQAVACSFQPPTAGYYRVTATVLDTQGRLHSSSKIQWINPRPARPELVLPSFTLKVPEQEVVGDTLQYSIESGADAATVLLSIERNEFLHAEILRLKKGANSFALPVTAAMAPGFYLRASIQKPRSEVPATVRASDGDTGAPFLFQQHSLVKVVDPESEPKLSVHTDKKTYAPGDRVALTLDAGGMQLGSALEMSVVVVDQALLQLYPGNVEELYDPRRGFLFPYRSDFDFDLSDCADLTSRLSLYGYRGALAYYYPEEPVLFSRADFYCITSLQSLKRESADVVALDLRSPDEEVVVFGIRGSLETPFDVLREETRMRTDFRDMAFWLANKTVTAGKPQAVEFKLPDNLTRWRVFVLATGKDSQFGMAVTDITTEKMTEVRGALPNRLVEGDELDARFTVLNRGTAPRRLDYVSKVEGALQAEPGASLQGRLETASSERAVVDLKVKATQTGTGVVSFKAGDNLDTDGVEHEIPVAARTLPGSAFVRGEIGGGASQSTLTIPLRLPEDALRDSGKLSLNFSVSRLDDISGALQYGRDYPYSCWEQKLSRAALAAMYLRAPEYLRERLPWDAPRKFIAETLAEAAGFQDYKGGMTFFGPASGDPSPYLSAYTLLVFSWLKEWGYETPAAVERSLLKYLTDKPDKKNNSPWADDNIAVALPLLLDRKLIAASVVDRVLPAPGKASMLENIHRLAALPALQAAQDYPALLESLDNAAYQDQHAYSFPLVSTAVAQCSLLSLLSNDSDFFKGQETRIERLAESTRKLMQSTGYWRNTQENVFCAKALLDHDRYFSREGTALDIAVNAGDFSRKFFLGKKTEILELKPDSSAEVSLSATGSGRAYYTARLDYAWDMDKVAAESQGLSIWRSYKIRQGGHWVELMPDTVLRRGQLVRVDLAVSAPTHRAMVAVVDPLPGNLEAQNPAFATSHMPREALEEEEGYDESDYVFYHRELGLQSVRFYAERVPAGEYRLHYTAQVIATGKFTAPPSMAEEMYAPEVYGRGSSAVLKSD